MGLRSFIPHQWGHPRERWTRENRKAKERCYKTSRAQKRQAPGESKTSAKRKESCRKERADCVLSWLCTGNCLGRSTHLQSCLLISGHVSFGTRRVHGTGSCCRWRERSESPQIIFPVLTVYEKETIVFVILWWCLVFRQPMILKFVWLIFHFCNLTISLCKNRTLTSSCLSTYTQFHQ